MSALASTAVFPDFGLRKAYTGQVKAVLCDMGAGYSRAPSTDSDAEPSRRPALKICPVSRPLIKYHHF